ncbi:MAG: SAM-dependent methyltransferase [Methylotenera sp.]|nr:SAM-dependent methyltransferase [Methylotenera sp.]
MSTLPTASADAKEHSEQLSSLIQNKIAEAGGWISFADFMHLALYAPALGYYSGGSKKFGKAGDFVTAPEISPLFAQTVSNQLAQVLQLTHGNILELGAGTGKLGADVLLTLAQLECLPAKYFILEVSNHLRQVQFETLQKKLTPDLLQRVEWLTELPASFDGVVLGNEVLDAIPAHIVHVTQQNLCERGVTFDGGFKWQDKEITQKILLDLVTQQNLSQGYITEFCPAATGLVASLATMLNRGIILMIDYGFTAREYYHPQRNLGTLMCHYQHYAHTEPLINVGLQDITAHVNFSPIAMLCEAHEISLAGYASQAQFLMNCGILDVMSQVSPNDMARYAPLAAAAQKLLSPAEMGDLFKVIAISKGFEEPLIGFVTGDKSYTL